MIVGLVFCFSYIVFFKFVAPELNSAEHWWFGISPEGIGTLGAILNFAVVYRVPPNPGSTRACAAVGGKYKNS